MTPIRFPLGLRTRSPARGAYFALPDTLAVFKGLLLRGGRGRGREKREGQGVEKGKVKQGKGGG